MKIYAECRTRLFVMLYRKACYSDVQDVIIKNIGKMPRADNKPLSGGPARIDAGNFMLQGEIADQVADEIIAQFRSAASTSAPYTAEELRAIEMANPRLMDSLPSDEQQTKNDPAPVWA